MISSATFHVITTELVVGSFAMAGVCFLLKALQSFSVLTSEKISQISDIVGHFALGFGLLATPFAILSGISSSPGSDVSSPLLVNKILLSMTAAGLAIAAIYARYSIGEQIWATYLVYLPAALLAGQEVALFPGLWIMLLWGVGFLLLSRLLWRLGLRRYSGQGA